MSVFIGIDPGLDGALAILRDGRAELYDTPSTHRGGEKGKTRRREYLVASMASLLDELPAGTRAAIEAVHAMPRQGVSSTFTFGRGLGLWEGMLTARGIPYELVTPQRWRKEIGIAKHAEKAASRACAQRLFPAVAWELARVRDDGRAEALLIALWCQRTYTGGEAMA